MVANYRIKQFFYTIGLVGATLALIPSIGAFYVISVVLMSILDKTLTNLTDSKKINFSFASSCLLLAHGLFNVACAYQFGLSSATYTSLLSLFMVRNELIHFISMCSNFLSRNRAIINSAEEGKFEEEHKSITQKINQDVINSKNLRNPEDIKSVCETLLTKVGLTGLSVSPGYYLLSNKFNPNDYNACANISSRQIKFGSGCLDKNLSDAELELLLAHEITHLNLNIYDRILNYLVKIFGEACVALLSIQLLVMIGNYPPLSNLASNGRIQPFVSLFPNPWSLIFALTVISEIVFYDIVIGALLWEGKIRDHLISARTDPMSILSIIPTAFVNFFKNGYQRGEETRADIGAAELVSVQASSDPINLLQKLDALRDKAAKLTFSSINYTASKACTRIYDSTIGNEHPPSQERDAVINKILQKRALSTGAR
jgi:hypothetical protein